MKKISLKWKFFLVACYVQLISFIFIIIGLIYSLMKNPSDRVLIIFMVSLVSTFLLSCLNNLLNIYIVHHFFPSTPLTRGIKISQKISRVIQIILWIAFLLFCGFGLNEELTAPPGKGNSGMIVFYILISFWIIGLFTLILQFQLPSYIDRNNDKNIKQLIEAIGENK